MASPSTKQGPGPSCTARLSIGFLTFLGLVAVGVVLYLALRG